MLQEKVKEDFMVEKKGKKKCDRRTKERIETNCKEKTLHEKFPKSIVDFAGSVSWQCLSSRYVKKNTEAIITVAQDQALRTNWIKASIDGVDCYLQCRVCHSVDGSSMHIACGCEKVAKRRYMFRHNLTATRVHREFVGIMI